MNKLKDLDSTNQELVENIKTSLKEQFNSTKDTWVMKGLYDYYLVSNSSKAVDVIVSVKEPHDGHFLDKVTDGLKSSSKLQHLTLLGHVVRRRPLWLFKISSNPVFHELLRILKIETDIVTVVSALLIINILLPFIPGNIAKHLQQIFIIFSKLAAMNASTINYHDTPLIHLRISLYTLFHRLYGMFPCTFLSFLKKEFSNSSFDKSSVFSHTVKPMLESVRMNPLLITRNPEWEVQKDRWKNVEPHDIIITCEKLLSNSISNIMVPDYTTTFDSKNQLGSVNICDTHTIVAHCAGMSGMLDEINLTSPSTKLRDVSLHSESTPTMIPSTPISRGFEVSSPYSEHEGSSPPEAAIEATPETTPSRDFVDVASPPSISSTKRSIDTFMEINPTTVFKVPNNSPSFPGAPLRGDPPFSGSTLREEVPQLQLSVPESIPNSSTVPKLTSRKLSKLLSDRNEKVAEDHEVVLKLAPVSAAEIDLCYNSRLENSHIMISTQKLASMVDPRTVPSPAMDVIQTGEQKASGEHRVSEGVIPEENNMLSSDVGDESDDCEMQMSGSPCTLGGLHIPDTRSLQKFARCIRTRYHSQTYSHSGGTSFGTSPQEINSYLNDSKVRRTHSCPEMKKSSPSSMFSVNHLDKLSLPEEKEEDGDGVAHKIEQNHVNEQSELVSCSAQTDELPPLHFPYEHLFIDIFPPLQQSTMASTTDADRVYESIQRPSSILQKYLEATVHCRSATGHSLDTKFLSSQLKLMSYQVQFEEHRREIHAERNRRLLGRSRRNKTLEEHNSALKDQVLVQQKEFERLSTYWQQRLDAKELEVGEKHKASEHWKKMYNELQVEYKKICGICSELESQLKEEKKSNIVGAKQIYEGKASLINAANELAVYQKEAKVAKELRSKVSELQSEILKAGETIVRYHYRLVDLLRLSPESIQHDALRAAYNDEVHRLKETMEILAISLDSVDTIIASFKEEIKNHQDESQKLERLMAVKEEAVKDKIKEMEKKYNELKVAYKRELKRAQDLDFRLVKGMRVSQFQNVPLQPVADILRSRKYVGAGGSSPIGFSSDVGSSTSVRKNIAKKSAEPVRRNISRSSSSTESAGEGSSNQSSSDLGPLARFLKMGRTEQPKVRPPVNENR